MESKVRKERLYLQLYNEQENRRIFARLLASLIIVGSLFVFAFTAIGQVSPAQLKPAPKISPSPVPSKEPELKSETPISLNQLVEPVFSESPFELDNFGWRKLPHSFIGNDFVKIYLELNALFKPKDEFETTAAYEKRIAAATDKILFGNIKPNSFMSFRNDSVESQYNADAQILSVSIKTRPLDILDNSIEGLRTIDVKKDILKELGTYEGQNAYGAKTAITKSEIYKFTIAINNIRDFRAYLPLKTDRFASTENHLEINLNLPAQEAKQAKANLSYLLIFFPEKPFVGSSSYRLSPKLDFPQDAQFYNSYLRGQLLEIWLFNRATGEIYKKLKPVIRTTGGLKINSVVRDNYLLLLDKSFIDILVKSGISPVDKTGRGAGMDLLVSYLKGNKALDSPKYKPFMDAITPIIKKHVVKTIATDLNGSAIIDNLKFGNYYIYGVWTDYSGTYVWDLPVHIEGEETPISLSSTNATYK
jgi:hypothetical protein